MFEVGWSELLVIAVVAIVVVGPRELPGMLRTFGKYAGQARKMAGDFQRQFNDALKEAELDEVRKGIESVRSINPLTEMKDSLNPLKEAGDSLRKAIEDPAAPKALPDTRQAEKTAGAAKAPAVKKPASAKKAAAPRKPRAPKPAPAESSAGSGAGSDTAA